MIRLLTLGVADLEKDDGTEIASVLSQPKRLALLVYLAIASPRGFHRRDSLLALFWPELDETRGRAALSQALYYLRRSMGADAVVGRGKEEVAVDPVRVWCDAVALDLGLDSTEPDGLARAVELYRGPLLPGFFLSHAPDFERWLEEERTRLRDRTAEAAWTLCDRAAEAGRMPEAVEWGRRALRLAAYDEAQLRRLIDLLDRSGDRAGAVRVYEEIAQQLAHEYELEPSPETQARIAEVRARARPLRTNASPPPVSGADAPPEAPAAGATAPATGHPVPLRRRARGGRWTLATAAAATAAVLLTALITTQRSSDSATTSEAPRPPLDRNRVAVLPLANISPTGEDEYIADGLTAELISRLARLRDLRVTPLTSVQRYRGDTSDLVAIGQELGVGTIIEGNVRPVGDSIRIVLFLTDAATEELLWSRSYDAGLQAILEVQRRIAEDVALELKVTNRAETERRRAEQWPDPDAAEEYLRGRARLGRSDWQLLLQARDHFRRAVELDPTFAEAWSGLATASNGLGQGGVIGGRAAWEEARNAAERALSFDSELPEAHAALAVVYSVADWDGDLAERHFVRAIELDPSHASARTAYAVHLRNLGRLEESLEQFRQARQLEPRARPIAFQEAQALYVAGRLDQTIELLERYLAMPIQQEELDRSDAPEDALDLPPFWPHFTLALARTDKGEYDAALASLDAADPSASRADANGLRGYIFARTGRPDEARAMLDRLERAPRDGFLPPSAFHRAIIHLGLSEHERALDLLELAATEERSRLVRLLKVEPKFDPLRGHPRFEALLRRLGLADPESAGR